LDVDHLHVRYSPTAPPIHQDLSLQLRAGEFVSLVGPSGCGKTTLLRVLAGLLPPSAGRVSLNGRAVTKPAPEMVLVFQDYARSLFPWLTVRRNVRFPLVGRRDLGKQERVDYVDEALADVGLTGFASYYPWQLSGGMQQRVAIARALASRPTILLLDEPFASVDALTREGLEDLVLDIRNRHGRAASVVLVTHDISEAIYMADRVLVLSGAPARLIAQLDVPLPRPREQIASRSHPEFLALTEEIHSLIGAKGPVYGPGSANDN